MRVILGPCISIHCSAKPVSWMLPTSRWMPTAGLFTSFRNCQNSRGLSAPARMGRGKRRGPMQSGRDVGDHEAGVLDLAAQLAHLGVGRGHLEPRNVTQPQLDPVEAGLLHEIEATLEGPILRNHVVADGFFHNAHHTSKAMTRAIRIIHIALVLGLVLIAGMFFVLRQRTGLMLGVGPFLGVVLAAIALVNLTLALGFLAPRLPRRPADQSPDDYWMRNETRGAAIILWALVEGAGLLSWIGYLLTGAWVPAAVGVLAVAALALLGPARFEGSPGERV